MLSLLGILGLYGGSILFISLKKVYQDNPSIDSGPGAGHINLKTRSIKSTKREHVLAALLLALAIVCFVGFSMLLAEYLPAIISFLFIFIGLLYTFVMLPGKESGSLSISLGNLLAPIFIFLLNKTKSYTKEFEKFLSAYNLKNKKIKKMSRNELIDLLDEQKSLSEGRSLSYDLAGSTKLLELMNKKATDLMLKLDELHLVGDDEAVGPILMDELHKSQKKIFLVNNSKHGIVGTVLLKDLIDLKEGGHVKKVYDPTVEFIEEEQDLREIMEQFVESGRTIFVVTDAASEKIGAIYFEDIIKKILED